MKRTLGGAAIPEERLVHNYLIEAGLAGRIPKGVRIWEETLRDGEQTPGVAYTPEEKIQIARFLDEIHVPIMDVGIPVVSKEEARGVRAIANAGLDATVLAAARTVRNDDDAGYPLVLRTAERTARADRALIPRAQRFRPRGREQPCRGRGGRPGPPHLCERTR